MDVSEGQGAVSRRVRWTRIQKIDLDRNLAVHSLVPIHREVAVGERCVARAASGGLSGFGQAAPIPQTLDRASRALHQSGLDIDLVAASRAGHRERTIGLRMCSHVYRRNFRYLASSRIENRHQLVGRTLLMDVAIFTGTLTVRASHTPTTGNGTASPIRTEARGSGWSAPRARHGRRSSRSRSVAPAGRPPGTARA